MKTRPPIPADVALALRQEARFGCCRCGHPIFEYHHIKEWAEEQHYRVEDMMLLCPNCHEEATHGGMTEAEQRKYKAHPHNQRRGYAGGWLKPAGSVPVVHLGGNVIVNDGPLLAFGGTPALGLSIGAGGNLEISLVLCDERDRTLAIVDRNEWVSGDPAVWDLEAKHQRLRLRQRKGRVALDLDARWGRLDIRAQLWSQGRLISITRDALAFGGGRAGVRFMNMTFTAMYFSLNKFDVTADGRQIELVHVPDERWGPGQMLAGTDPDVIARATALLEEARAMGPNPPSETEEP